MTAALPALFPEAVRSAASTVLLSRGDMLFRLGEPVAHIHYVARGEVLAVRYMLDCAEAVCSAVEPEITSPSRRSSCACPRASTRCA